MADDPTNITPFSRRFDHIEPEAGLVLALLGHDLRAALAEVQAGLSLIADMPAPAETHAALARCRASSDALGLLVDQAMGVCLGQKEPGVTAASDIDTERFLKDLHFRWASLAQQAGCSLRIEAATDLPRLLRADRTALQRVLANLVGNALSHGRGGEVALSFGLNPVGCLTITLTDEGPGFPPDHLPLLQRDFALPPALRRPGGGLGLQSVKHLVDAMQGNVMLDNRSDRRGAIIALSLPLEPAADLPAPPKPALPDLRHRRLLAADDSATSRSLLRRLAGQLQAEIDLVADGTAILQRLATDAPLPDALILDNEMPGLSGLDLLHHLGSLPANRRPPVLMITSHATAADQSALISAGAAAVLTKPLLCPVELGSALIAVFANPEPLPSLDLAALRRLRQIAGPAAAAELFQRLTEDLADARSGLAQAAARADTAALRAHSHVIIALAGTAGAQWLHERAITLNARTHDDSPVAALQAMAAELDRGIDQLLQAVRQEASGVAG